MDRGAITEAIDELAARFLQYDWTYNDVPGAEGEKYFTWYGEPDEEIMVLVFKGRQMSERFHRQDFFFFNFAYEGCYETITRDLTNLTVIEQDNLCVGQPFTGYAIRGNAERDIIIVGVLIQKETFFRSFLPVAASNAKLLHFFLGPQTDARSDEFLHLHPRSDSPVRTLVEMMLLEYANRREDTQDLLKSLALALIMYTARQYELENPKEHSEQASDAIVEYMSNHVGTVTLQELAEKFSYHPNYLSTMLHRETGRPFSTIVLEQRMERAGVLLRATTLSVEEIAAMLGYGNTSNFYKAFRGYYGCSPREFAFKERPAFPHSASQVK